MIKAVVFDFDRIVVDSEPLHFRAFQRIAASFGHTFDYDTYLADYIGYDDRDAFRAMLAKAQQPVDEAHVAALCEQKAGAFVDVVNEGVEPFPGLPELIGELYAAMPIAIASGATRADITLILGKLDLAMYFETIVTADEVARSKPHPQTYAMAVELLAEKHPALDLKMGDGLAIEDTAAGIASAKAAGLMTLGVTTSMKAEALFEAGRVIESLEGVNLAQLRAWFG